jgi:serine acetyltransferase
MLIRVIKFIKIVRESEFTVALEKSCSYLGLSLDYKNTTKFRDLRILFSCDIKQELPDTTILPHPVGIVISGSAEIGENVRIYQNVTIGWTLGDDNKTAGAIGDDVTIYSGATIIGDVNIGEGAVIGSNAVVLDDVEEYTTVVGVPAREV